MKSLNEKATKLLEDLISIKSFSGEEDKTATRIGFYVVVFSRKEITGLFFLPQPVRPCT